MTEIQGHHFSGHVARVGFSPVLPAAPGPSRVVPVPSRDVEVSRLPPAEAPPHDDGSGEPQAPRLSLGSRLCGIGELICITVPVIWGITHPSILVLPSLAVGGFAAVGLALFDDRHFRSD